MRKQPEIRCGEKSAVGRNQLWREISCGEKLDVEGNQLWRKIRCGGKSAVEKNQLWVEISCDIKSENGCEVSLLLVRVVHVDTLQPSHSM